MESSKTYAEIFYLAWKLRKSILLFWAIFCTNKICTKVNYKGGGGVSDLYKYTDTETQVYLVQVRSNRYHKSDIDKKQEQL